MKRILITTICCFLFFPAGASAEQVQTEQQVRDVDPVNVRKTEKAYVHSYYEHSWVSYNGRRLRWKVLKTRAALLRDGVQSPYIEVGLWDRGEVKDTTVDVGTYFKGEDAFGFIEAGFGEDADFVPKFQTTGEYVHRLAGTVFGRLNYRYTDNAADDVHILSPGLIYYFGNHYVRAEYGVSHTQGRDEAHWGVVKGQMELSPGLDLWGGFASGQRLFDIYEREDASKQYGSIIFIGLDKDISDQMTFRLGFSYSKERPDFIKRSLDWGLNFRF